MINSIQVTIGSAVTQVSTTSVSVKQITIQNNAAHKCYIGDYTVTTSKGIMLGSGGGSNTLGAGLQYVSDLREWWIAGTQNDVIDVFYVT